MSQVGLLTSIRADLKEEVAELERMIVSARPSRTVQETGVKKRQMDFVQPISFWLHLTWESLVAAEIALERIQAKYPEND